MTNSTTAPAVEASPTPPTLYEMLRQAGASVGPEHLHLNETPLPRVPYPTQVEGVSAFLQQESPQFGLWDDPGTGKTLVAIALMALYAPWGNRFVVLMPPILLEQLGKTLKTWGMDFIAKHKVHMLSEGPAKRANLYKHWDTHGWPDALCMSYEMYRDLTSPVLQPKNPKTGIRPKPLPPELPNAALRKLEYNFIIPDEAHALGNAGSKIHERVYQFVHETSPGEETGCLLMSGTPLRGKVEDVYGLIRLLMPKKYGSYQNFVRAHCVQVSTKFGMRTIAYDNLDYLHRQLYAKGRRVEAREVLTHMKEPLAIEWPVSMHPEHKKMYDRLVKEQMAVIDGQILDLTSEQRLRMALMRVVTCPHLYIDTGKAPKNVIHEILQQYIEMTDAANPEKNKAIIFCWFQETCEMVADFYRHYKREDGKVVDLQPLILNGNTTDKERKEFLRRYHNDKSNRVAVINFLSGGAGLDLQSNGHEMLCLEPTGLPHHYRQAIARVARGEQQNQCIMRIVTVKGTVYPVQYRNFLKREEDIQEVARDAHQMFDFLTGG